MNKEPSIQSTEPGLYNWFNSKETKKLLGISDCELMHRRERGKLKFEKRGNSYFYRVPPDKKPATTPHIKRPSATLNIIEKVTSQPPNK